MTTEPASPPTSPVPAPAPGSGPSPPPPRGAGPVLLVARAGLFLVASLIHGLVPDAVGACLGGLVALWLLPGYGLASGLPRADRALAPLELLLIAVALGGAWLILASLLLVLLGWFSPAGLLAASFLAAVAVPALLTWRRQPPLSRPLNRGDLALLLTVGLVATPWRLSNLGYSMFQGDEVDVVLRAAAVVQHVPEALFYHGKGPAEILVLASLFGRDAALGEASARLPFALAGLVGLLGASELARRWFGLAAGLATGVLLGLNGFLIAFAHLVQYQSLVFLLSIGALLAADRFRRRPTEGPCWAATAGLLVGVATLGHYDGLFAGPPVLALLGLGVVRSRRAWRAGLVALLLAGLAGGLALAVFFLPYLSSPLVGLASERVVDRVGFSATRNNLDQVWPLLRLYLSQFYVLPLLALAGLGLLVGLPGQRNSGRAVGGGSDRRFLTATAALWGLVPLVVALFLVRKPGTHVHVGFEGLAVLAGAACGTVWAWSRRPSVRGALLALGLAAFAPTVWHHQIFYADAEAEVLRRGQATRQAPFWRRGEQVPRRELFGFPYQAGWKAVGLLYADGTLQGSYDSNEMEQISYWYARDAWRCTAQPRYYLIAEDVMAEIEPPRKEIAARYVHVTDVTVRGEPRLHIFERGPTSARARSTIAYEALAARFDRDLGQLSLEPGPGARGPVPITYQPLPVDFETVQLLGYRLYAEDAQPGGVLRLDLFWLPRVSGEGHLAAVELGQGALAADGQGPGCDHSDSWRAWRAGQPFAQRHSLPIGAEVQPGRYPLRVGMDSAARGGALPIRAGPLAGQTRVTIAEIEVRPAR